MKIQPFKMNFYKFSFILLVVINTLVSVKSVMEYNEIEQEVNFIMDFLHELNHIKIATVFWCENGVQLDNILYSHDQRLYRNLSNRNLIKKKFTHETFIAATKYLMGGSIYMRHIHIGTIATVKFNVQNFHMNILKNEILSSSIILVHYSGCSTHFDAILDQASKLDLFKDKYHWLIIDNLPLSASHFNRTYTAQLNLKANSELQLVTLEDDDDDGGGESSMNGSHYDIYDIWNPTVVNGGGHQLQVRLIANYTPDHGFSKSIGTIIQRRLNLFQMPVRAMFVVGVPINETVLQHLNERENQKEISTMHKFSMVIVRRFSEIFNIKLIIGRSTSWGYLDKNGSWDGVIRALMNNEADMSGSPTFIRADRSKVADFHEQTWKIGLQFIFRHPNTKGLNRNIFLEPFSNRLWYGIAAASVIILFILKCTAMIEHVLFQTAYGMAGANKKSIKNLNKSNRAKKKKFWKKRQMFVGPQGRSTNPLPIDKKAFKDNVKRNHFTKTIGLVSKKIHHIWIVKVLRNFFTANKSKLCNQNMDRRQSNHRWLVKSPTELLRGIVVVIGGLCQQGVQEVPRLISGRCVILFLLIFGFSIYQFYSANLTSSLLVKRPKTIKTLRDLMNSSLHLTCEDVIYMKDYLNQSTDPLVMDVYKTKILSHDGGFYPPDIGMNLVKRGGYAYHVEASSGYKIIKDTFGEKEICELGQVEMVIPRRVMGQMLQKGSPLKEFVRYGIKRQIETGLLDREDRYWHQPKPDCVRVLQPSDLVVNLDTVLTAWYFLACGALISVTVFMLEMFVNWTMNHNN